MQILPFTQYHESSLTHLWSLAHSMGATYLINQIPSPNTKNMSPYELLYHQPPNYADLRTFGCLCFPNLSHSTPNKFSPCSTECVFLGYPHNYIGYKYLNLTTNKIQVSRHVTFHESTFPFLSKKNASLNPPKLQPNTLPPPSLLLVPTSSNLNFTIHSKSIP